MFSDSLAISRRVELSKPRALWYIHPRTSRGGVAQLVEQRTHKPRAGGSKPFTATIFPNTKSANHKRWQNRISYATRQQTVPGTVSKRTTRPGGSHPTQPKRIPCEGSFVGMAMRRGLFIYPVLFLIGDPSATRDLSRRTRLVERTRQRPIAERLSAVATNMGVPMVDNHLDRHVTSPDTTLAFGFVGPGRQSSMTSGSVYLQ